MKLIYCQVCHDVVKLHRAMRFCACGRVYGKYIDNIEAEVSKTALSLAIGNGSLDAAIALAMHYQEQHPDAPREKYQKEGKIEYAWARPNVGVGNPHSKYTDKDIRAVQMADLRLIERTNTKLDTKVVDKIVAEGWDETQGKALPAWFNGKKFVITDGNHRVEALSQLGEKYAPIVQITKEEFDHVKFSDRSIDFMVHVPEHPIVWAKKE